MLSAAGLRAEVDARNEKLGYRIREAQTHKVPVQIVIGDGEMENETVTLRRFGSRDSLTLSLEEGVKALVNEAVTHHNYHNDK